MVTRLRRRRWVAYQTSSPLWARRAREAFDERAETYRKHDMTAPSRSQVF